VVRDVSRQVFEALAFMHTLELVHTDIKPENICLVSGEERLPAAGSARIPGSRLAGKACMPKSTKVRVIDFGTAEFCAHGKQRHALVGTRQYRSPEVMFGSGWDDTLDVWAVACVMTEMLCGRQLFPAVGVCPLRRGSLSVPLCFAARATSGLLSGAVLSAP